MGFVDDLREYLPRAAQSQNRSFRSKVSPDHAVVRYAREIQAIRPMGEGVELTPIGQVFLQLVGRHAVRWLLHVEVGQSAGPADPFRLSRETAAYLARRDVNDWTVQADGGPEMPVLVSPSTLNRLFSFGILQITVVGPDSSDSDITGYHVFDTGKEILQEIASSDSSPFKLLAHALLQDEVNRALAMIQPAMAAAIQSSAAESIASQARLMAHELRNALVPVQASLASFYEDLRQFDTATIVERHRPLIDEGVKRIFRFVSEMLRATSLAANPPEPVDPVSILRDAIATVSRETKAEIRFLPHEDLPPLLGHRSRLVLALIDLLRNAAHAVQDRVGQIEVAARISNGGSQVEITVEDNGPGVPEELRRAIFADGFTLRPGGGGHGLALLRDVVEHEMQGTIVCHSSPLGGAKFIIMLPVLGEK